MKQRREEEESGMSKDLGSLVIPNEPYGAVVV